MNVKILESSLGAHRVGKLFQDADLCRFVAEPELIASPPPGVLSLSSIVSAPAELKPWEALGANAADFSASPPRRTLTAPDVAARITPSLSLGKRWAWLRQQSIASSKLPTTAKASAVMRAGSQSITLQALVAAVSSAWLAGWACVRSRCFQ